MNVDLEERLRHGLRELADSVAVAPVPAFAPHLRVTGLRTRSSGGRRRSWAGPMLAAAAVIAVAMVAAPSLPDAGTGGAISSDGQPRLPGHLLASMPAADLSSQPLNGIVAMFSVQSRSFAVSAFRDAYRVVDVAEKRGRDGDPAPTLLAADGSKIAVADLRGPERDVAVVKVDSGVTLTYEFDGPATVTLLAWSPDARYLAYAVRAYEPVPETRPYRPLRGGSLALLDTETGRSRPLRADGLPGSVAQAAFSADGGLLAVQEGGPATNRGDPAQASPDNEIVVLDPAADVVRRRLTAPSGFRIAGQQAWSPGGGSLALERDLSDAAWRVTSTRPVVSMAFLDITGTYAPFGGKSWFWFLGWRTDNRIVTMNLAGDDAIMESTRAGGVRKVLTRVEGGGLTVGSVQLAFRLLPVLVVGATGAAQRGRWSSALRVGLAGAVVILAALAVLAVRWHRRRQFLRRSVLPLRA